MDGKKVLILALGILAGMYVIANVDAYSDLKYKLVKPSPDSFDPVGDDGVDALALAAVGLFVASKIA